MAFETQGAHEKYGVSYPYENPCQQPKNTALVAPEKEAKPFRSESEEAGDKVVHLDSATKGYRHQIQNKGIIKSPTKRTRVLQKMSFNI